MAYAKKKSTKPAKVEEEDLEDDDELEELDDEDTSDEDDESDDEDEDDEEEEPAPKKRSAKNSPAKKAPAKKAAPVENKFDVKWLCELVAEKVGKEYKPAEMRNFLRKMNSRGELGEREAKTRYAFGGEKDPVVVSILKQIKGGAIDKAKKEKLDELKARSAEKKAANPKAKRTRKPAVVEDDDFEDDDED